MTELQSIIHKKQMQQRSAAAGLDKTPTREENNNIVQCLRAQSDLTTRQVSYMHNMVSTLVQSVGSDLSVVGKPTSSDSQGSQASQSIVVVPEHLDSQKESVRKSLFTGPSKENSMEILKDALYALPSAREGWTTLQHDEIKDLASEAFETCSREVSMPALVDLALAFASAACKQLGPCVEKASKTTLTSIEAFASEIKKCGALKPWLFGPPSHLTPEKLEKETNGLKRGQLFNELNRLGLQAVMPYMTTSQRKNAAREGVRMMPMTKWERDGWLFSP
jgi:hypothetical protein